MSKGMLARRFASLRLNSQSSQIWLVAIGGWLGRAIQVLSQLVAIRILTEALGVEGYSIFAVLASLAGWFALADFSIAISAQNFISERRVSGDSTEDIVLTGALLALGATAVAAILIFAIGPWLSSTLLRQFPSFTAAQKTIAFWAVAYPGIGTALGGVAYRIFFAEHRGYLANLFPAIGTLAGTAGAWVISKTGATSLLAWSTFIYYLPLALIAMGALATLVLRARNGGGRVSGDLIYPLLYRAFKFWVFGILAAAVLQVDYVILAQTLRPGDIVTYNVASKVFALILFVYSALLYALWPVCSEAIARGDWNSTLRQIKKYILMGMAFTVVSGTLFGLLQNYVVSVLSPSILVRIPLLVIALLTLYSVIRVWTDTFGMVLQSMNDLTIFWIAIPFQALCSIGFQAFGAWTFGLPGMIGGLVLCFVLTTVWILPLRCLSHVRKHRQPS